MLANHETTAPSSGPFFSQRVQELGINSECLSKGYAPCEAPSEIPRYFSSLSFHHSGCLPESVGLHFQRGQTATTQITTNDSHSWNFRSLLFSDSTEIAFQRYPLHSLLWLRPSNHYLMHSNIKFLYLRAGALPRQPPCKSFGERTAYEPVTVAFPLLWEKQPGIVRQCSQTLVRHLPLHTNMTRYWTRCKQNVLGKETII